MLVDLQMRGRKALVVGAGDVGVRKALTLRKDGAEVTVVSRDFAESAIQALAKDGIRTVAGDLGADLTPALKLLSSADFLVVATDDGDLNRRLSESARDLGVTVSVVDDPALSDCTFPATAQRGGFTVAVSTGGRSPTMARLVRDRLAEAVTEEDLLMLALHEHVRNIVKARIPDARARRDMVLSVTTDARVVREIQRHDLEGAKRAAEELIAGR